MIPGKFCCRKGEDYLVLERGVAAVAPVAHACTNPPPQKNTARRSSDVSGAAANDVRMPEEGQQERSMPS